MSQLRSWKRPQPSRPGGLVIADFPSTNEIASRAHELFIANGRRISGIFEYWEQAEQELLERAARRTLGR
jgi:hypothetical protein